MFRNVQYQSARVKPCGSQSCLTSSGDQAISSVSNQGFDSAVRNLIDDSVQEENASVTSSSGAAAAADAAAAAAAAASSSLDVAVIAAGHLAETASLDRDSASSFGGLDSPLPPPPVRCCCIQGCVYKKKVLKDGRRPAVCTWNKIWIQVSNSLLVFYRVKSLRGYHRFY